jgi:hypothetical protein
MATDECRDLTGGLQVASAGTNGHAATRLQVEDLISELLDDAPRHAAIIDCWQAERMGALDAALFLAHSASGFGRAKFYSEAEWLLHYAETMLAASSAPNWQACRAIMDAAPAPTSKADHPVAALLAPPMRMEPKWDFRSQGERRSAAILLAIRLYALDHQHRLPPSLADLTPDYLKKLPPDPFAGDGSTFRYRAVSPAVLYSVGEDGVDGGGAMPVDQSDVWSAPDAVFPISVAAPPSLK